MSVPSCHLRLLQGVRVGRGDHILLRDYRNIVLPSNIESPPSANTCHDAPKCNTESDRRNDGGDGSTIRTTVIVVGVLRVRVAIVAISALIFDIRVGIVAAVGVVCVTLRARTAVAEVSCKLGLIDHGNHMRGIVASTCRHDINATLCLNRCTTVYDYLVT